jgi:anthranilate phosphoribosyltransferase
VYSIHAVLSQLLSGAPLSTAQAEETFEQLLTGGLDDAQIGSLLSLIQVRGPSVDELVGAAAVMRRHVRPMPWAAPPGADSPVLIDTCGTGGAPKTFNISTGAAIVAAAASPRVRVAKHGNRGRSGRGAADVLLRLGVNVDASPEIQARCLEEARVCFCFAVHHHPAMKHAAGARRALGFPTIFNLLGPLTNPAGAKRQLLGVYDARCVPLVASALARLGTDRAMIVHGGDGLDELTTTAPTLVTHVEGGRIWAEEFDALGIGIERARSASLIARDLEDAAATLLRVLAGEPGPARDIVALNAGAALFVAGAATDYAGGVVMAEHAMESGDAARTLETLVRVSHSS